MRPGAESQPGIQTDHHGVRVRGRLIHGRTHPEPPAEAHGLPILQPDTLPIPGLDRAQRRGAGDVGPQTRGQFADRNGCPVGIVEERAHRRVTPQPDLTGFGLEHGIIAAVDEGD